MSGTPGYTSRSVCVCVITEHTYILDWLFSFTIYSNFFFSFWKIYFDKCIMELTKTFNVKDTMCKKLFFCNDCFLWSITSLWLRWPLWPQEGSHVLLLCDQFSGMLLQHDSVQKTALREVRFCRRGMDSGLKTVWQVSIRGYQHLSINCTT